MPTTEPTWGWPIADGPDPVKQYPSAVDQPFKQMLATQIPQDSGWRDISTLLDASLTGYASVRRVGPTIEVSLLLGATTAQPIVTAIGACPAGFAPSAANSFTAIGAMIDAYYPANIGSQLMVGTSTDWIWILALETANQPAGSLRYFTDDPWPSSLPGVSVTQSGRFALQQPRHRPEGI